MILYGNSASGATTGQAAAAKYRRNGNKGKTDCFYVAALLRICSHKLSNDSIAVVIKNSVSAAQSLIYNSIIIFHGVQQRQGDSFFIRQTDSAG